MTEPTKEQTWKEEARKAYQDQQSQDNEGGCREPIGFVQGYIAAKKSDFEETKTLKEQLAVVFQLIRRIKNACSPSDIITCEQELEKLLKKQNKENKERKMTDLKNKLEEVWIQRGSFGYVVVKDKDSNPEWINRPIQVCSVSILYTLQEELQKTREQLEKCEKSLMKVACFETHGENKYISHAQAYTGVANFARRYFQDKENKDEK